MISIPDLTELEPVAINDETEVKIPISPRFVEPHSTISETDQNTTMFSLEAFQYQHSSTSCTPESDVVEYNRILTLMQDLPEDMFVDRLLLDFHQSETNLDTFRFKLFDMIKSFEDFPFDSDCELKRRVHTRQGDSVASKLARDIHVLFTVIEGEDINKLKDLISTQTRHTRNKSMSRAKQQSRLPMSIPSADKCVCNSEMKQLKELFSAMQADVLLLKQRQSAIENIRNSETKSIKESVQSIANENKDLKNMVTDNLSKLQEYQSNMQSSLESNSMEFKETFLTTNVHIKTLQENMIEMKTTLNRIQDTVNKIQKDTEIASENINNAVLSIQPETEFVAEKLTVTEKEFIAEETTDTQTQSIQDKTYAEIVNTPIDNIPEREDDLCFGNMKIPTIISSRDYNKNSTRNKKHRETKKRDINFKIIHEEITNSRNSKRRNYDKYLHSRNAVYADGHENDTDDEDFSQYVRRRTKRFYIGGFMPSINENKIANYINKRGPKVTKVSIFKNKHNPRGNVVIRINVESDENVDLLTEDPYFWPEGVTCRPWLPYRAYQNNRGSRSYKTLAHREYEDRNYYDRNIDDVTDDNQYAVLSDVDID